MKHKNRFLLLGLITVMLLALAGISAQAATFTSQVSGKWSNKTTWLDQDGVPGVPGAGDDVVIGAHTIALDGDFACKSLLLNNTASVLEPEAVGEFTLGVAGDITFTGNANLHYQNSTSSNGKLNLNITGTSTVTTTAAATGLIGFNVNNLTVTGNVTQVGAHDIRLYGNLAVNGAGKFAPAAAKVYMLGNNTKIINSSTTANSLVFYDLDVSTGATVIKVTASSSFKVTHTMTVANTSTFAADGGTITFTGTAVPVIVANGTATTTLYNVVTSGAAPTSTGNYTVAGDFTCNSTTYTPAAADVITFSGSNKTIAVATGDKIVFGLATISGTYTLTGNVDVAGAGATAFNVVAGASLNATSGTLSILGVGGITNAGTTSLYNLVYNNAGATSLAGAITVKNDITNTAGTMTGGTITMTGGTATTPANITLTAATFNPAVLNVAAGAYVQPSATWALAANNTLNIYGTFKSAVAITGAAASSVVNVYSGATLNASGAALTTIVSAAATAMFDITGATLTVNFPNTQPTVNLVIGSSALVGFGMTDCNNLVFSGATGTIAANIIVAGDVTDASAGAIAFAAANGITMSGTGKHIYQTDATSTFDIGVLTINGTVTTDATFSIIGTTAGATLVVGAAGSFEATAGTITFNGAAGGITNNAAATALKFYNLTYNAVTATNASFYVKGSIARTAGTLTASAGTIYMTGTVPGSAMSGQAAVTDLVFYNLNISGPVTSSTFMSAAAGGSLTVTSTGSFVQSANDFTFVGAGTITNTGTLEFFNLLLPNAASVVTTNSSFNVANAINLGNATALFTATAGTITLKGTTTLTPPAANDRIVFNNLLVTGAGVVTAAVAQSITVAGNLTVADGGSFVSDVTTTIKMTGVNREIRNNGTLSFGLLNIAANAKITTANDFSILGGAGALALASSTASLIASDGSITINNAAADIATNTGTLVFNNLQVANGAATLSTSAFAINGNFAHAGGSATSISSGIVTFSGTQNQYISGAGTTNFTGGLVVNKPSGDLVLAKNIGVAFGAGNITLTKGDLDLNGNNITITAGNAITLVESNGYKVKNTSTTNGYVQATAAAAAGTNIGGLGVVFSAAPTAAHVIRRYHTAPVITSKTTINRYYTITPAANITLSTNNLSFKYDESELPGGSEGNLVLYRSRNAAAYGTSEIVTDPVNTASNLIKITSGVAPGLDITSGQTDAFAFVVNSGVIYSAQTGNWSDVNTWSTGSIPTPSDMVVIKDGHTVSADQDATVNGLVIEGTGKLQPAFTGTYSLTDLGELTFKSASARFASQNASGLLSLGITGGTIKAPRMIRLLDNDNLKVNNLTLEGYFSQSGDFTVEVAGNMTVNGISDLNLTTGKFYFNGAGNQTITRSDASSIRFNDIQIGNASVATIAKDFAITGDITNGTGSFTQTEGTVTFDGGTQTITDNSNGNLKLFNVYVTNNTAITTGNTITFAGNFNLDSNCTFTQSAGAVKFTNTGWKTITNHAKNDSTALRFAGLTVSDASKIRTSSWFELAAASTLEVKGSGKFVADSGAVNFINGGSIVCSKTGDLEFYHLSNAGALATTADMTIKGHVNCLGGGTFVAASPSTVTFSNKNLGLTTLGQKINTAGYTFYNLVVADESKLTTANNIAIEKDMTVLGNGAFAQTTPGVTTFQGARAKTLTNNGSISFYDMTIANTGSNVLATSSSFTVARLLTVGSSSTSGALKASGNSVVTINGTAGNAVAHAAADATGKVLELQNLVLGGNAVVTPAANTNFIVKGDFTDNAGLQPAGAHKVFFKGSAQQKINGTGTTKFYDVELDNTLGILLAKSIELTGTSLTLTSGDIDLNGNNIINMSNANPVLTETAGYTVKNTVAGSGYLEIGATPVTEAQAETANTGILFEAGAPTGITIKRFHNALNINGTPGISRYYQLTNTGGGPVTGLTMNYDNSELGSADAHYLSFFKTSTANAATTTAWTGLGGTPNTSSATGSVTQLNGITGLVSGDYVTVAPQGVAVTEFPAYGIEARNMLATTPLIANAASQNVLGFALTSNGNTNFTQMYAHFNVTPENKLQNFKLWMDEDNYLGSYGRGVTPLAVGVVDGTDPKKMLFSFSGSPVALTPATAKYFFITADVAGSVSPLTPAVQLSFNQDDLTFDGSKANAVEFGGASYKFEGLSVTVATDMSPKSGYVTKGINSESIYAFSLTPPANAAAFNFTGVTVKVNVNNASDDDTDFSNFKLWLDNNKNGIYDSKDEQLGSTVQRSNGKVTFTFNNAVAQAGNQYVMTCDVAATATSGKTIDAQVASKNDMALSNGAVAYPDGPFSGNQLSVGNPGVATKLAIVSIEPDLRIPANSNLPANVLVDGARFTVKVQAQDAAGRPVKRAVSTPVRLYVSSGASSMYYDGVAYTAVAPVTASLPEMNTKSTIVFENVVLTNGTPGGELELVLSAQDDAGNLTTGTSETLTLRSKEPAISLSGLTVSNVAATTATLNWNNPLLENCIIVMRALEAPSVPQDGYNYTQASANNFSQPSSQNGTTDVAKASVVVYKGTDNTVDVNGLSANTTYYAAVYNYNGVDFDATGSNGIMNFLPTAVPVEAGIISSFKTANAEPLAPSNTLTFTNITSNGMTLNWVKPAGASKSLVVARIAAAPVTVPADGIEYQSSTVMGTESSALGESYVVYSGMNNSVNISNLSPNTSYYFTIYEYNGAGTAANYLTSTYLSGNRSTLVLEPTAQASGINFSDMVLGSNTSIKVNWINGTGAGRVVFAKAGSAITEMPTDYIDNYGAIGNSTSVTFGSTQKVGDAYVIYSGSNRNYVTLDGLTYGQTYYFRVFEYNGTGTASTNSTVNYLTSEAAGNPSSREADSYENNNTLAQAKEILANGNYYTGIISSANDVDWLYFTPDVADGFGNIRLRLIDLPYNYTLELYNADGRLLRRSNRTGTNSEIQVINNVPAGDYYIKIYSADGNYSLTPYRVNATTSKSEYRSNTP